MKRRRNPHKSSASQPLARETARADVVVGSADREQSDFLFDTAPPATDGMPALDSVDAMVIHETTGAPMPGHSTDAGMTPTAAASDASGADSGTPAATCDDGALPCRDIRGTCDPTLTIGARLRAAREARKWSVEDVAVRLHLPLRVLQRIEANDLAGIDAIYLRGYLTSYARLVGVPGDAVSQALGECVAPPLIATGQISHSRWLFERYSVPAVYLLLTGLIVGPSVWLATHGGLEQNLARLAPLDPPAGETVLAPPAASSMNPAITRAETRGTDDAADPAAAAGTMPAPAGEHHEAPLMASVAPFPIGREPTPAIPDDKPAAAPGTHALTLRLSEPSWVEVIAQDGTRLEYGLLAAGAEREYRSAQPVSVRLGNCNGAQVTADGQSVDLGPYRHTNVAHFKAFGQNGLVAPADS